MDKALSNYLENRFRKYKQYPMMIKRRRAELEYYPDKDESLSTSKSTVVANKEEAKRIKVLDDKVIANYYRYYKGVEKTLEKLDAQTRTLIEEKYWGENSWKNWYEFAKEKHYSTSSIYRLRDKVLAIFAEEIGEEI